MIKLAVAGAAGRTGLSVLKLAARDQRFEIVAALTKLGCNSTGTSVRAGDRRIVITETLDGQCDVLVDFAVAAGTMAWLGVCKERHIPMVIGATGHNDQQLATIGEAAKHIPVLKATNFSLGIQAVMKVVGSLARELGESYDVEIVEAHHRFKVDAPSGTALTLVEAIWAARGSPQHPALLVKPALPGQAECGDIVFGRHGQVGERPAGQIGVHAIRMGDAIGQHEIHFSGPGETVTIRHSVHSRDTFAAGALRAAAWIVGKPAGLYGMADAVG